MKRRVFTGSLWLSLCVGAVAADIYVAPEGVDSAPGSKKAPLKTIQAAADRAKPGDVVLVAPGIYRERVSPPTGGVVDHPIVFRSIERHQAVIKGSDVWEPAWKKEGDGIWSGFLDMGLFKDTKHMDGACPFDVPFSVTPRGREGKPESLRGDVKANRAISYNLGQVFVDGAMYMQAATRQEMELQKGSWYYQPNGRQLFIHFLRDNPHEQVVEIATRRRIFAPHERGLGFIEVDGFVMEHCGNQYPCEVGEADHPEWQQAGALGTRSGHDWVIRNNIVRLVSGVGIDLGEEGHWTTDIERVAKAKHGIAGHHLVESNYVEYNGAAGIVSYNGANLTLKGNVVVGNNFWGFTGNRRKESAGIKLYNPDRTVVEGNYVGHNIGRAGIWFEDGAGQDTRVIRNLIVGNEIGVEVETGLSKEALIGANFFIDNKVGLSMTNSGGLAIAHNAFLGSDGTSVQFQTDPKREGKWTATNVLFYNNIVKGRGLCVEVMPLNTVRSEGRLFDGNIYDMTVRDPRWKDAKWRVIGDDPVALAGWQAYLQRTNSAAGWEGRSIAVKGISYNFDSARLRLRLFLPVEPVGVRRDLRLTVDYFGSALSAEGAVKPGPYRTMQKGDNQWALWTGIPVSPRREPWAKPE